jgi:dTDP-4-dehydrorhamnose 3,5-epimerase
MQIKTTSLAGVLLIEPTVFGDERGFFMETYQERRFVEAGLPVNYVQDNHSGSLKGTLRGLHYQIRQAQGKLVRAVAGEFFDVVVDLRRSSPTFGQWEGFCLSAANRTMLWVPPGFGHGFYVVSEWAEMVYKATDFYAPEWERTIRWDDPTLSIRWPLQPGVEMRISPKDAAGALFTDAELYEEGV